MKYIKLLRLNHWVKNLFIFVPAFFGGAFSIENLYNLSLTFLSFSLTASCVYIINDYRDRETDRQHPEKKFRPQASGAIGSQTAFIVFVLCALSTILISYFFLPLSVMVAISIYFLLNLLYSLKLKQIPILDLIIVASGFVLRIVSGAQSIEVELSFWLLMMTFLFAMFVVIAKRRDDFKNGEEAARGLRKVNSFYNLRFLNYSILTFSTLMLVCYVMYTFFSPYFKASIYHAFFSSLLVFTGLLRYLQVVFVENKAGNPTSFAYKDKLTLLVLIIWLSHFAFLIYN